MRILNPEHFRSKKKSDTLVVYGSGYSVAELKEEDILSLSQFDSIGFNWFCKSKIPTTFYLMREQTIAVSKDRRFEEESRESIVEDISRCYSSSCLIVIDMLNSCFCWRGRKGWSDPKLLGIFSNEGVVLTERCFTKVGGTDFKLMLNLINGIDIFSKGIYYRYFTLSLIVHLLLWLKYDRIIFVGVDLYDHRYFWLKKNELRRTTQSFGRTIDQKHKTADDTIKMVNSLKEGFGIKLYTYNPISLLANYIEVWGG